MLMKSALQRVEIPILRQSFDSRNVLAINRQGQCQACKDGLAINQDGASATLTLAASILGAR